MAGAALIPLITMIPSILQAVVEITRIMRSPDMPVEDRTMALDALAERLEARAEEIRAMELPERRLDDEEEPRRRPHDEDE
jgi:hypothetical protein